MNPGSNVKTFISLVKWEMLITSGPMVPDMESSCVDLPVARFFSSYFVLMRFSDGMIPSIWNPAELHGRSGESRAAGEARAASCARRVVGDALRAGPPSGRRRISGPSVNACAESDSAHAGQGRPKDQALAAAVAYFLRNLSTRPPVSTIFCLPV